MFWTRPTWERKKRIQRTTMAAQLLQNPLAGKEQTFRVPWLKPYYVRPTMMNVYIMGDPSHGHNKTSDRTAIVAIGIDSEGIEAGGNKYLLDGFCHRMQLAERWERLRDLHKRWSNMPGVQHRQGRAGNATACSPTSTTSRSAMRDREVSASPSRSSTGPASAAANSKKYRVGRLEPDFRDG